MPKRIASIDVLRGLTMLLMIFVNDFWTLENIPKWLMHAKGDEDYLGFSDVIFPAFLFIVGLSIPFAIDNRLKKEHTISEVVSHILQRTFALLIMGVFMVNLENMYSAGVVIGRYWWQILMAGAFVLIWNNYQRTHLSKTFSNTLIITGVIILIVLALIYRGGSAEQVVWMRTYWWGILGLIGWAYLTSALIYLIFRRTILGLAIAWIFFLLFNMADFAGWLDFAEGIRQYVWIVGSGAFAAFSMAGVVASALYKKATGLGGITNRFMPILLFLGLLLLLYGFATRPFWGISKIQATPSWIGFCTGISFIAYAVLYWLVDLKKQDKWTWVIGPAGKSTLTCYLVPYFYYAIITLLGLSLPMTVRTGAVGLTKSMLFAFLIVAITGILYRSKISLKI